MAKAAARATRTATATRRRATARWTSKFSVSLSPSFLPSPLSPVPCSASRAIWPSSLLRDPVLLLPFGGGSRQVVPGAPASWRRLRCSYVGLRAPSPPRGVGSSWCLDLRAGSGSSRRRSTMLCARSAEPPAKAEAASVVRLRKRSHHRRCLGSFRSMHASIMSHGSGGTVLATANAGRRNPVLIVVCRSFSVGASCHS
jgi:hypothetical protein